MSKSADTIYFQKQTAFDNSCGVCALNNLMGKKAFTDEDLTLICRNISPDSLINPYKSVFGGDYDVSALILALKTHDVSVRWLKAGDDINQLLVSDKLIGFLINADKKKNKMLTKIFNQSGRHWTCLTKTGEKFFYMDSQSNTYEECEDLSQAEQTVRILKERGETVLILESELNVKGEENEEEEKEEKEVGFGEKKSFVEF